MKREYRLKELPEVVQEVATYLTPGMLIGFKGTLGSGKTTFIRELVAHLGSSEEVTSPTYTLEHVYPGPLPYEHIYHWDLYRLSSAPVELFEALDEEHSLVLVEWPENAPELSAIVDYDLHFAVTSNDSRTLTLKRYEK
jgi:tRNA threonylcarbamoyladenosine biosynthesis protein TsaE